MPRQGQSHCLPSITIADAVPHPAETPHLTRPPARAQRLGVIAPALILFCHPRAGTHDATTMEGTNRTSGGTHAIEVDYFQGGAFATLNVLVSYNGGPSGPINASWLSHSAAPNPPPPPSPRPPPPPSAAIVAGRAAAGGCQVWGGAMHGMNLGSWLVAPARPANPVCVNMTLAFSSILCLVTSDPVCLAMNLHMLHMLGCRTVVTL